MNNGIMGVAYKTAKKNNRNVTGIAPEIYKDDFKEMLNKTYQRNFTSQNIRLSYNVASDYMTVLDLLGKFKISDKKQDIER